MPIVIFGNLLKESGKTTRLAKTAGSALNDVILSLLGLEYDKRNFLLMHAMGPNVAGVIGSAVAAGALLGFLS